MKTDSKNKEIRLRDLIRQVSFDDVKTDLIEKYDQGKNMDGYEKVFHYLLALKSRANGWTICCDWVHEDADEKFGTEASDWIDTDGISPKGENFAIEFKPWNEWLGMKISQKTMETMSPSLIVASCLYEMTFIGYDEEKIQSVYDNLMKDIKEIKRELKKEKKE